MANNRTMRRTTAILAADVVGYSRLMGEVVNRTLAALRELRQRMFEPVVAANDGHRQGSSSSIQLM